MYAMIFQTSHPFTKLVPPIKRKQCLFFLEQAAFFTWVVASFSLVQWTVFDILVLLALQWGAALLFPAPFSCLACSWYCNTAEVKKIVYWVIPKKKDPYPPTEERPIYPKQILVYYVIIVLKVPGQPRTQVLHCFYRDQRQLIIQACKGARWMGNKGSAWQKMPLSLIVFLVFNVFWKLFASDCLSWS